MRLASDATSALLTYRWPGNVRELERVIQTVIALADDDEIRLADLPPHVAGTVNDTLVPAAEAHLTVRQFSARYIERVLRDCDGNQTEACRRLGISHHAEGQAPRTRRRPSRATGGLNQSAFEIEGVEMATRLCPFCRRHIVVGETRCCYCGRDSEPHFSEPAHVVGLDGTRMLVRDEMPFKDKVSADGTTSGDRRAAAEADKPRLASPTAPITTPAGAGGGLPPGEEQLPL